MAFILSSFCNVIVNATGQESLKQTQNEGVVVDEISKDNNEIETTENQNVTIITNENNDIETDNDASVESIETSTENSVESSTETTSLKDDAQKSDTPEEATTESEPINRNDYAETNETTDYLIQNIDPEKVKEAENISESNENQDLSKEEVSSSGEIDKNGLRETIHQIVVNTTLMSPEAEKYDNIWDAMNNDEPNVYTNSIEYAPIYESDEISDCYIAFLDFTMKNGTKRKLIGVDFVTGSEENPEKLTDIVYDENTGIVYIPKYYYFLENGEETLFDLQCQVASSVDLDNAQTSIHVVVENNSSAQAQYEDVNFITDPIEQSISFPLIEEEDAGKISASDIQVYFNDKTEPADLEEDETIYYNNETGEMTIIGNPSSLYNIKIVINGQTFSSKLLNFLLPTQKVQAAKNGSAISGAGDMNTYPIPEFSAQATKNLKKGMVFEYSGRLLFDADYNSDVKKVWEDSGKYIYVPHLPGDHKASVWKAKEYFYKMIQEHKYSIEDMIKKVKQKYGWNVSNFYYGGKRSSWSKFALRPPTGVIKAKGTSVKMSWGGKDRWRRTNTKLSGDNSVRFSGMCVHPANPINFSSSNVPYYCVILNKTDSYMVLGVVSGKRKGGDQCAFSTFKVKIKQEDPRTKFIDDTVTFKQKVSIKKVDGTTNTPLPNAIFTITDRNGKKYKVKTNAQGLAEMEFPYTLTSPSFGYYIKTAGLTKTAKNAFLSNPNNSMTQAEAEAKLLAWKRGNKPKEYTATFTVEEISAPNKYLISDEVKTYTIKGYNSANDSSIPNSSPTVTIQGRHKFFTASNIPASLGGSENTNIFKDAPVPESKEANVAIYYWQEVTPLKVDMEHPDNKLAYAKFKITVGNIKGETGADNPKLVGYLFNDFKDIYRIWGSYDTTNQEFNEITAPTITAHTNENGRVRAIFVYKVKNNGIYQYLDTDVDPALRDYLNYLRAQSGDSFQIYESEAAAKEAAKVDARSQLDYCKADYTLQEIGAPPIDQTNYTTSDGFFHILDKDVTKRTLRGAFDGEFETETQDEIKEEAFSILRQMSDIPYDNTYDSWSGNCHPAFNNQPNQ